MLANPKRDLKSGDLNPDFKEQTMVSLRVMPPTPPAYNFEMIVCVWVTTEVDGWMDGWMNRCEQMGAVGSRCEQM
jgi:hypothetical protein